MRPCEYNEQIAQKILDRVATHACGIRKLCAMYEDMPHSETIAEWRYRFKEFSVRYMEARTHQSHILAESAVDISDETEGYIFRDRDGNLRVDSGIVAMQDKKIKSRQWLAGQILPKIYGSRAGHDESISTEDTLSKIKSMVADFNKSNESDV